MTSGKRDGGWSVLQLDRNLAPVRRVLAWVYGRPDERAQAARFSVPIARSWLIRAQGLGAPEAVQGRLEILVKHLDSIDSADPEARVTAFAAAWHELTALDRLLGLPLSNRGPRKPVARPSLAPMLVKESSGSQPTRDRKPEPTRERKAERRSPPEKTPAPVIDPVEPWSGALEAELCDSGVTEGVAAQLASHDICTVDDLLRLRPTGVTPTGAPVAAGSPLESGWRAVHGRPDAAWTVLSPGGATAWLRVIGDAPLRVAFSSPLGGEGVPSSGKIIIAGRTDHDEDGDLLADAEVLLPDSEALVHYGLGDLDVAVRAAIRSLVPRWESIRETLPGLVPPELPGLRRALGEIHRRGELESDGARRRQAYEEAFLIQLGMSLARFRPGRDRGLVHAVLHGSASKLGVWGEALFSDAQQLAFEDIKRDIRRPSPMLRVLAGEVGAGRGAVAVAAAAMVADSRHQVLVLCPNPANAEQRFLFAEARLRGTGLVARLADGAPTRGLKDALKRGEIQLVFGTPDLLHQGLECRRLGMIVAFEGQNQGSVSRLAHELRPPRPDVLIVSTAPLGASSLLTAYPDHDVTVLPAPTGETRVRVYPASERSRAYAEVAAAVDRGEQALVTFPLLRGQDALDGAEADRVAIALASDGFPGARIGVFHGDATPDERLHVYKDVVHRRLDVMVSTTYIEDAPSIPALTSVIVEQADRVSPARLRRIFGFVRAGARSTVHLVLSPNADAETRSRLDALALAPMGPLARVPEEHHAPAPCWTWFEPERDLELLLSARQHVHAMLRDDPSLRAPARQRLAAAGRSRWAALWPDGPPCPIPELTPDRRRRRRRRRRK
ncbi:MAG: ATP-dependent DNA helicase RecG [Myxococcota bacterium]|jgi:ATP-dependent DNA helicase RecG